jgi:hypothetical protein
MRTPCKFFNTQRGCIRGDACTFAHERGSSLFSQGGRAPAAGRGGRVQAGRGGGLQSAGGFSSDLLKQLLTELGCSADPQPVLVQRWVQLALQQCERRGAAGAADVLRALRGEDGSSFLRALGQQLTCTQVRKGWRCMHSTGLQAHPHALQLLWSPAAGPTYSCST